MEDIMSSVLLHVAAIGTLVLALVEVVKRMEIVAAKYMPLVAIIIGGLTGVVLALGFNLELAEYVLAGVISGLASSGLYDSVKTGGKV